MTDQMASSRGTTTSEPRQAANDRGGVADLLAGLTDRQLADIEAHMRGLSDGPETYPAPQGGWTCFHCGETFKTCGGARLHFGTGVTDVPVCTAVAIRGAITSNVQLEWRRDPGGGGGYDFIPKSIDRAVRAILKASTLTPSPGSACGAAPDGEGPG